VFRGWGLGVAVHVCLFVLLTEEEEEKKGGREGG